MFRTYEPARDRLVAVKVFRLDVPPEQARTLADALAAATQAGLFHPSIVEPLAADVQDTVAYRAEEYVAAESLDVAIRHYAPSSLDKALPFITQLAGAIDFARAASVGHGALHLRDIFVTPDEARAGGFGIVDALERVGLRAPVRRPYSAPERIAGQPWGTPADVFSLGAITYELLTGKRPSGTGDEIGALGEEHAGPQAAGVRAVLARAMDDDPSRRFPAALAFASELETAARGGHAADVVLVQTPAAPGPAEDAREPEAPAAQAALPAIAAIEHPADADHEPADVLVERDDDLANAKLHPVAAEPAERLPFDAEPEAETDLALTAFDESPEPEPVVAHDAGHDRPAPADRPVVFGGYAAATVVAHDRGIEEESPRRSTPILPMAIMLVVGLVGGFVAGRLSLPRDAATASSEPLAPPPSAPAPSAAPPAAASGAREGKPFSEQAVASSGAAASTSPRTPAPERRPAPAAGRLVIRSTPSQANVTINNQWKGRTPLTLEKLTPGAYQVRVVRPGFVVAHEDVTLSAADASRTLTFKLQPVPAPASARASRPAPPAAAPTEALVGSLSVDSRPQGAKVFVDGKLVGTTPARLPQLAIGSHVVRLELAEHRVWSTSTQVVAGREVHVAGSLERIQ